MSTSTSKSFIGVFQMIVLMFLTRMFTLLTFTAGGGNNIGGFDNMIVLLLSFVISMLMFIPIHFTAKYFPNQDILDVVSNAFSPSAAKAAAILYWLFCVFNAAESLSGFEFFLSTAVYPNGSHIMIIISFLAVCMYTARKGVEPLSRVAVYIFFISVISYIFISGSLIPKIELTNFTVPFSSGVDYISKAAVQSQGVRVDVVLLLLLIPYLKGNTSKVYVGMSVLILAVFEILTFVTIGSLGEYLNTQMFPYYSAAGIAEIDFVQRLDSLHMAVWVMISFVRVSLFLFASSICLKKILPVDLHRYAVYLNTALALIMSALFSESFKILNTVIRFSVFVIPFFILAAVIPILLSVRGYILSKRK